MHLGKIAAEQPGKAAIIMAGSGQAISFAELDVAANKLAHVLFDAVLRPELPAGRVGTLYFSGGPTFSYHGDPAKTAAARDPQGRGWATLGDVGYLDEDGFLYLTDRVSHMIISGGVNIYPQEAENLLAVHPKVADVAVIGVPDPEMGEQVKAVVQPAAMADAGPELAAELIAYCRDQLAHYKCPRSVDFRAELPRLPTGKLLKRMLRDEYARAYTQSEQEASR